MCWCSGPVGLADDGILFQESTVIGASSIPDVYIHIAVFRLDIGKCCDSMLSEFLALDWSPNRAQIAEYDVPAEDMAREDG